MSGFVLVYNRDGALVAPDLLQRMADRLGHRGPDGSDVLFSASFGLAHQHFWTTPEEVGERQPLSDPAARHIIVFVGRLDNRPELLAALGLDFNMDLSDARLVLEAYDRWGTACVERLLGPFAFALVDLPQQTVFCARDVLGDRTFYYYLDQRLFVAAVEPVAVLEHEQVLARVDQSMLVLHFLGRELPAGNTYFVGVREILAATALCVGPESVRSWRYWHAGRIVPIRYRRDEEYTEHFRELLIESTSCRLRSVSPPAFLMSGGVDSTSIVALASSLAPGKLLTISYVYNELAECDEREFINLMVNRYGLDSVQIPCDDAWPLHDPEIVGVDVSQPFSNPFEETQERGRSTLARLHRRVVLSGSGGDYLYEGAEEWLFDLLADGRIGEAARELSAHAQRLGWTRTLRSRTVRAVMRRTVKGAAGRSYCEPRGEIETTWLTDRARRAIPDFGSAATQVATLRCAQVSWLLGPASASPLVAESRLSSRYAVEARYPYRDRRIVEFALALPAYQLYNCGSSKHILRECMRGLLPERVRVPGIKISLLPLLVRGLCERARVHVETILLSEDAVWQEYVRRDWVLRALGSWQVGTRPELSMRHLNPEMLVWRCVSFEQWRRLLKQTRVIL